mmetsp:Transcript_48674/g.114058  ORF Transcript_48674/g.114058 Transcript_48674/m.114058 type:complete len:393 (+) Transcript_48674:757-1935(+)
MVGLCPFYTMPWPGKGMQLRVVQAAIVPSHAPTQQRSSIVMYQKETRAWLHRLPIQHTEPSVQLLLMCRLHSNRLVRCPIVDLEAMGGRSKQTLRQVRGWQRIKGRHFSMGKCYVQSARASLRRNLVDDQHRMTDFTPTSQPPSRRSQQPKPAWRNCTAIVSKHQIEARSCRMGFTKSTKNFGPAHPCVRKADQIHASPKERAEQALTGARSIYTSHAASVCHNAIFGTVVMQLTCYEAQVGLQLSELLVHGVEREPSSPRETAELLNEDRALQMRLLQQELFHHKMEHVVARKVTLVGLGVTQLQQRQDINTSHLPNFRAGSSLGAKVGVVEQHKDYRQHISQHGRGLQLPAGGTHRCNPIQSLSKPVPKESQQHHTSASLCHPVNLQERQ